MKKSIELLAPAGNLDICKAVINAGADAVYLAGSSFGARAYAGNLNQEELLEAIDYAHLYNSRINLTVNTLTKEKEILNIIPFLEPLYEAGLDAVIVQDLGVAKLIKEAFPYIALHASTQMSVMSHKWSKELLDYGFSRIVLPREMTLEEIKSISSSVDIELEAFIHGALCYGYSGQCLFSALRGGRSGNRGKCAQPCRLPFTLENNKEAKTEKTARYLCAKDIAAIKSIPDIIEAGVMSLKIEGRMKNVNYAAGVTSIYRKYLDKYLEGEEYKVDSEDINNLMDLYNRGSFSEGMFTQVKGAALISLNRAKHKGTKALEVISNDKGAITFKALEPINAGDVFEINEDNSFTSGKNLAIGEKLFVNLPKKYNLDKGTLLYRMNNAKLQSYIQEAYIQEEKKIPIDIYFEARKGQSILIKLYIKDRNIEVTLTGPMPDKAIKAAATSEAIDKRLRKLGGSHFQADNVDIILDQNLFIPVGVINDIRRTAIDKLREECTNLKRRKLRKFDKVRKNDIITKNFVEKPSLAAMCMNLFQLERLIEKDSISRIYVFYHLLKEKKANSLLSLARDSGKEIYIALPPIVREKDLAMIKELLKEAFVWDGLLVRSLEELSLIKDMKAKEHSYNTLALVTDYNIYAYNSYARSFFKAYFKENALKLDAMTLPIELSAKEIVDIGKDVKTELLLYGKPIVMLSEHCLKKTLGSCDYNYEIKTIKDFNGALNPVFSACDYCNNIIFNDRPINLIARPEISTLINPDLLRLDFIDESPEEIDRVIEAANIWEWGKEEVFLGRFLEGVY